MIEISELISQIQAQISLNDICVLQNCSIEQLKKEYNALKTGENWEQFVSRNRTIGRVRLQVARYKQKTGIKK